MTEVLGPSQVRAWLDGLHRVFATAVDDLTEMDRLAGDGDFGHNMSVALDRIESGLIDLEEPSAAEQLRVATRAFADNGGSSGPLLSAVFRELSRAASAQLDLPRLAGALEAGNARIQALGGAAVGDSTMIDALDPGASSLLASAESGHSLAAALAAAARAARAGADSTVTMTARRGRASYVGDRSNGVQDPGAVFIAFMFETLSHAVQGA